MAYFNERIKAGQFEAKSTVITFLAALAFILLQSKNPACYRRMRSN